MTRGKLVVGVDTQKHLHVAVALSELGARCGALTISADARGYAALEAWARQLGRRIIFAVEGTGSYGAGLASALRRSGHAVVEVNRGDRRARRANGKSDQLDAEAAARAVLSGQARAIPEAADGVCEMLRQVKIARDTAVKARTQAMITLKCVVVNAPAELRAELDPLTDAKLLDRCAGLRPGPLETPLAATKHALRALARRWLALAGEIAGHDRTLDTLTKTTAPTLRDGFGIGLDTAAERLIVFGDNPERVRSEAAFAKLCGVSPIPASSAVCHHRTTPSRARRPPTSQRRPLPRRHRPHAVPPADHRLRRSPHPGRTHQTRHHPLPQALPRPRGLRPRPRRHARFLTIGASTR